jgi:hypothetical protein
MLGDFLGWFLRGTARILLEAVSHVPSQLWEGLSPVWVWLLVITTTSGVVSLLLAIWTGEGWLYHLSLASLIAAMLIAIAAAVWPKCGK